MLLAELFAMVEIDAPAERVWQILTDFRRYPEWNPFMPRVAGEAARRAELEVLVQPDGAKALRLKPRIVTFRPPREMRWRWLARLPGLFVGEQRFVVEALGATRSRLIHEKRFRGLAVPFLRRLLNGPVKRSFEATGLALKQFAERKS
jgi:hypothetical protein